MSSLLSRTALFRERKCHINIDIQKLIKEPPLYAGPFIKLDSCIHGIWKGNIMLVHSYRIDPTLDMIGGVAKIVERSIIDSEFCYNFTKWIITVEQTDVNQRQNYIISYQFNDTKDERIHDVKKKKLYDGNVTYHTRHYCFFVPGKNHSWKWSFFSCNDLSHTSGYKGYAEKYGGVIPLWTDLVHKHHKYQYNLLIGLGDQVYLDEVFEHVDFLDRWTRIPNRITRETIEFPAEADIEISKWVFFYYLRHFSQAYFKQALATIPSLFIMSDHDTYDGQGSYPPELENSPVLKRTREILQRYYLLFQQHQDPKLYFSRRYKLDGDRIPYPLYGDRIPYPLYGDSVTPCVKHLGNNLAILALDTRFERTRDRIIKDETYEYIFEMLEQLPATVVHLVIATEIPLIFPDIRIAERWLRRLATVKRSPTFNKLFSALSLFKRFGFPFGEPVLLTDMIDHWNSDAHIMERNRFLHRLQEFSARRYVRITFIGGDVHCCGVGRFATPSTSKDVIRAHYENEMILTNNFENDHRLMYQIISSAIANVPPPAYIIKGYHWLDRSEKIHASDGITEGRMLRFFKRDTKGRLLGKKSKKLLGSRNWCSVEMSTIDESLFFELHVEMFLGAGKTVPYNIVVPRLGGGNE